MSVIVVIPARLGSTRLPGKVLADLDGRPLLWHVWNRVCQARRATGVYVATDAEEVRRTVEAWGGRVLMTRPECRSGTERIASIVRQINGTFVLNVQGDEPLIEPSLLDALVEAWERTPSSLVTAVYRLTTLHDLQNPNVVKVVRAADGRALYFSRSPIPFVRDVPIEDWLTRQVFWGHVGVYGYPREVLERYPELPPSDLENVECLEQLRLIEAGYCFRTVETPYRPVAVDTPQDLARARELLAQRSPAPSSVTG